MHTLSEKWEVIIKLMIREELRCCSRTEIETNLDLVTCYWTSLDYIGLECESLLNNDALKIRWIT
jgi:hypothetical protein